MASFRIVFENPWFLLLLIPAAAFTLIPYFRSPKKYRRNRNRITSIVLHLVVMVLSIAVLAGIVFQYRIPNKENELILLVDKSSSNVEQKVEQSKDDFIYEVLKSTDSKVKVGIVTFAYDQVYAAELSYDTDKVYSQYLSSIDPDNTATDFASALQFASEQFADPAGGRIVILSDGVETDGDAINAVKAVAAKGIKVDTVCFPNEQKNEVQILSAQLPEETIRHGEKFTVTLNIQSSYTGLATLSMFDDATMLGETIEVDLIEGPQTVELEAILPVPGLHRLAFEIMATGDTNVNNNAYNTYVNIHVFDRILVIESLVGESTSLKDMITDDKNVTVVDVNDQEKMPKTLVDLRNFDEVILVNISNADMPDGFDDILYQYVTEVGGGLFTVCGNKEDANPNDDKWEANAFTRDDMYGSNYQKLLPVEIVNYTPPLAVIIVIDCSGSMFMGDGSQSFEDSKLYSAMEGAKASIDALTERDWVGVMTFAKEYDEALEMTPRTERNKILAAIDNIPRNGGETKFTPALERAGSTLLAMDQVEKRHIILVTDGEPTDQESAYGAMIKRNAELGITMSIVGIGASAAESHMNAVIDTYATVDGEARARFYNIDNADKVASTLRQDLMLPEIKDVNYGEFTPTVETMNSVLAGVDITKMPTLDGFYGSKLKNGAEVILSGEFVPIYAQWKVGKGMVGSFMCDLNGTWSSDFVNSDVGAAIVNNIIISLFPTEDISVTDLQVTLKEKNYGNQMNIFGDAAPEDTLEITVTPKFGDGEPFVISGVSAAEGFSRVSFEIKDPGVYEVNVVRKDAEGNLVANSSTTIHKAFSYSQEYNMFYDAEKASLFMADVAEAGDGFVIEDSSEVLNNILQYFSIEWNPRLAFIIIALVAFLLDIAVRKFKFKWPHELIREYKNKKNAA